jgi:hypothetical protein
MGLDFIRKRAGSFKKAWRRGREDLARNDLLTKYPECTSRTVVADIGSTDKTPVGTKVVLQVAEGRIDVYQAHARIGQVASPPSDLAEAMRRNGGSALGEISQLNQISGTADVCVKR